MSFWDNQFLYYIAIHFRRMNKSEGTASKMTGCINLPLLIIVQRVHVWRKIKPIIAVMKSWQVTLNCSPDTHLLFPYFSLCTNVSKKLCFYRKNIFHAFSCTALFVPWKLPFLSKLKVQDRKYYAVFVRLFCAKGKLICLLLPYCSNKSQLWYFINFFP